MLTLADLTPKAVPGMLEGRLPPDSDNLAVQVLSIKPLASNAENTQRVRLVLSDGEAFTQAMMMFSTDSDLLHEIQRNTVLRIVNYQVSRLADRNILVVVAAEKLGDADERLGVPAAYRPAGTDTNGTATPESKPSVHSDVRVKPDPAARPSYKATNYSAASSAPKIAPPTGRTKSNLPYYPIEGLSPYQNKWMIRARVTAKGDIKHYNNARGPGKLFWVNLLDETGEIRATAFNDAVDMFYSKLQEGKVYYIARARVGIAKKQFTKLDNDYELTFNNDTEIEEASDAASVPSITFNFVPLHKLQDVEPNQTVDVIGVVQEIGEESEITARATQRQIPKRELTLVDQSGMSVRLTLWGATATNFRTDEPHPVIAFKGVRVGDFGGRSLSMIMSSAMYMHADVDEHYQLKGWYEGEGSKASFKAYSGGLGGSSDMNNPNDRRLIAQAVDEGLGHDQSGKADNFSVLATLHYIKNTNMWYPACKSDGCNKKVTMEQNGEWQCLKCDKTWPEPEYRYLFTGGITDLSGHLWVNGFNEIGETFLGKTANELHDEFGDDNPDLLKDFVMSKTGGLYVFAIKAKWDVFNVCPVPKSSHSLLTFCSGRRPRTLHGQPGQACRVGAGVGHADQGDQ